MRKGGQTTRRKFIPTPSGVVGTWEDKGGVTKRSLHFKDHLGSVIATTDWNGDTITEENRFNPWGRPIEVENYKNNLTPWPTYSESGDRGYTGHEMLASLQLIHMNGRIYDPVIGRFLSADPFVQNPFDLQSYNRYAYVLNNPLKYVDPSGYGIFGKVKKALKIAAPIAIGIVAGVYLGPGAAGLLGFAKGTLGAAMTAGFVGGFSAGLSSGLINRQRAGGVFKSAFIGGGIGAAMGGIMHSLFPPEAAAGTVNGPEVSTPGAGMPSPQLDASLTNGGVVPSPSGPAESFSFATDAWAAGSAGASSNVSPGIITMEPFIVTATRETTRLTIGYTTVPWFANVGSYAQRGREAFHAFAVIGDPVTGETYASRAGPGSNGNIRAISRPYDRFFTDHRLHSSLPDIVQVDSALSIDMSFEQAKSVMRNFSNAINNHQIMYSGMTLNSNSYISGLLQQFNIRDYTPSLYTPGWETPLAP